MDFAMVLGGMFVALLNGLEPEVRERTLGMLEYFSQRETFSPAERQIFSTMIQMSDDVFTRHAEREVPRNRDHLRVVN